jgi:[protein-PII] uridylyltransferase
VLLPGDDWALAAAYDVLLGARVELHRLAGRPGDILALQEQDGVAAALQMASADALMGAIAASARTIAWTSDEAWQRIDSTLAGPAGRGHRRDHPVASGVVVRDGEIHLDHGANPASDPTLVLRVATASARKRAHIERATLDRLAAETAPWPDPWPPGAVDDFVALLLQGHAAIGVLESLDQRGLLVRVLPEWVMVRSKPQRNAYHRFTVDRHLWETAANAADLADRVKRPDLLVLGALLHDLGKGLPGDHTDNGVALVGRLGPRMGLNEADTAVLVAMVRHHLLLPDTATRRDLSDDATLTFVADAVGDVVTLELLAALTEADSKATGPSAWSSWKAELVAELADRVAHVLGGGDMAGATWSQFPSEELLAEMGAGRIAVHAEGDRLTVVAPDRPGLFSAITGVLALHGLPVLDAMAHSDEQGMAASSYRIEVPDETGAAWHRVEKDVERALAGRLALEARLAERAHTYRRRSSAPVKAIEPSVRIDNGASSGATVIEVRGADRIGLLHRLTQALAEVSLDIRRAKVQTMGHEVLDSFYVRTHEGEKVTDADHLGEVRRALLHAVSG